MSLDDLRKRFPHLSFALYAMTPGGAVTLEVIDGAEVYSFVGRTAEAAITAAFPPDPLLKPINVFE